MFKKNTCILFLCCIPLYTQAFNGVFLTGSGQISSGMGGVSLAGGVDRTSISDNPANLVFQNDGIDAQISLLNIRSKAKILNQESSFESNQFIPIPSLSLIKKYNDDLNYGLSITGAGASVDYGKSAIHGFPADNAKDNLAIAVISPTLSYKISPNWSIGASLNWGIQQFRAKGVLAGLDEQGTPSFFTKSW
ncbi:OmpP1/FadL family transporter [Acinetobacter johnsonii]|uniref:OmpP1/FadL family transporter n=1 Tax=Acinetobacter johnsonii TaxID=40214 RepID=UPI000A5FD0D7|nr:outer membrane protein transport protein [Acinetobacter johnsonii]